MNAIGIICEYNPFHNGHLYHLKKVKEIDKDAPIVLIMSTNFTQRGEVSLISKKEKTELALKYGIDLIIELPFVFSTQSADIFASASITLLKELQVNYLAFGSETNDINLFKDLSSVQLHDEKYQQYVKEYLDLGLNYPTALSKSLSRITNKTVDKPNDILGLAYVREIIKQNALITPICIKRTSDFHNLSLNNEITSASSIREALKNNIDIKKYVPKYTYKYLNNVHFNDNYFQLLKYKILSENSLDKYQSVDEGLSSRIKKYILNSSSLDELISNVKTKRYTYQKLSRMFTHILCNLTKEEVKNKNISYIRVLGFSKNGQTYLNKIKKHTKLPIITNYSNIKDPILDIEFRVNSIYASILDEKNKKIIIEDEYKCFPIKSN